MVRRSIRKVERKSAETTPQVSVNYLQLKDMLDKELASLEENNSEIEAILKKLSSKGLSKDELTIVEKAIETSEKNTNNLKRRMK